MKQVKERLTNNPVTSIVGGIVVAAAVAALIFGKIDGVVFAEVSAIGLVLLGLKDPSWLK